MKMSFKLNKIQIIAISIGAMIMVGFGVFSFWMNNNAPTSGEHNRVLEQVEKNEKLKDSGAGSVEIDENVEQLLPSDLTEYEVQSAIHHMTHQKVAAEKKWGALLITEERVKRLYEVAVANEGEYDYGSTYIQILERWVEGDFSKAVHDHNTIWKLQGGNVGEATGLLSAEQEKKYIDQYLK